MEVISTEIPEILIIEPGIFTDDRGYFYEIFRESRYKEAGIKDIFVQDNLSFSKNGTLRGLHYQYPNAQGKLVYAVIGEVFDVAVDIRRGSPTFSRWVGIYLSEKNKRQIWVPGGFAHGFCVLSEYAIVSYKCTDYYNPDTEQSIRWDDPSIAIDWPEKEVILSPKDASAEFLKEIPQKTLPPYEKFKIQ